MTLDELKRALARLKVETGSLACLGCGYEHSCGVHGCAILNAALQTLEKSERQQRAAKPRWISTIERLPPAEERVLAVVNGSPGENITLVDALELAGYGPDGWMLEAYPAWKGAQVSYWAPLPDLPEELTMQEWKRRLLRAFLGGR